MGRITSLQIDWYDNGVTCAEQIVRQAISVYRNKKQITYSGYDAISKEPKEAFAVMIDAVQCEALFSLLEAAECAGEYEKNLIAEVCDGSAWNMRLRHSDRSTALIEGTVYYPPHGKEIEKYIRTAFEAAHILTEPMIFGCQDYIQEDGENAE